MFRANFILFVLILFIFSAVENNRAQEKVITGAELDAVVNKGYEKLDNIKYRVTSIGEWKNIGKDQKNKRILEFLPPGRKREIWETNDGDGIRRTERLYIGDKTYVKFNNEEWQSEDGYGVGGGGGGINDDAEKTRTVKFAGKSIIDGKAMNLYEDKIVTVKKLPTRDYITTEIIYYWFDEKERIVKTESRKTFDDPDRFRYTINEYDYEADIKIEAPVIKKRKRVK